MAYVVTYRVCLGLQHPDRAVLEHGIETGIIRRLPNGEFIEVHQPLGPVDDHGHPVPLEYQGASVPKRMNKLGSAGIAVKGFCPRGRLGHLDVHEEIETEHATLSFAFRVQPRTSSAGRTAGMTVIIAPTPIRDPAFNGG